MIRDAQPEDFATIEHIHAAMGSDYNLPQFDHPLFIVRKVAIGENGLKAACFLRLTAETYLWLDPDLPPRDKMLTMQELQPVVLSEAWSKGLDDVEARIPETVQRRFQKRLKQLGWVPNRSGWHPWTVQTHA